MIAALLLAQIVTATPRGVVVAHDGRIELHGRWSAEGVENATAVVAGNDRVAVLDALNNEAVIAELATGKTTRMQTAETPVGGAFVGNQLYVLTRDGGELQGDFVRESKGLLYVYSRVKGTLTEFMNGRVTRRLQIAPFASDFEISGRTGYLVYPRDARIRTIDLVPMRVTGTVAVGAVPVDLAFAGGGTAITARILAVADPSSKRIWFTEGTQSTFEAVARGFLRGFLGLGLFGSRASQFPTGVDRVIVRDKIWVAYDSSSGTLYRFTKSKSSIIAKGIAPQAFAVTADGVVYWKDGTLVAPGKAR
jgi:DNA-binding beta-propeller fold protein YncE